MSIQYDSTELQNATYVPRYIKHETSPERLVNSLKLARQDGEVIINDTMAVKYIDISGVLIGTSRSDLETKIDAFKELIARKDKNLDISWAGGTRRYVCRSINHEFSRDFFHILHVPYTVRFFVPAGYGVNTSETTALNKSSITATTDTEAITFSGSYPPKARHKITINTRGNADVVKVENVTTGDYMEVDLDGFVNSDYFEIDEENQTVKKNGTTDLNYRGKFPSAIPGSNSLKITISGSGSTVDQSQLVFSGTRAIFAYSGWTTDPWQGQSFVPSESGRINKLSLYVDKTDAGALGGPMQFLIFSDDNGKPGENISSSGFEIAHADVPSSAAATDAVWTGTDAQRPFLTKGQRYWIVLNPAVITGSDSSNYYGWYITEDPTDYENGKAMFRKGSSFNWQDGYASAQLVDGGTPGEYDMYFAVYRGVDGGAASHSLTWQIYYTKKYL